MATEYALSLKQPWAALLVHGRKTIEIRRWPTTIRGRVFIHAARGRDKREEASNLVWSEWKRDWDLGETTHAHRCIIGVGTLVACRAYHTPESFVADQPRHLNDPSWFQPPVLYGFEFTDLALISPPISCPGQVRFFRVDVPDSLIS